VAGFQGGDHLGGNFPTDLLLRSTTPAMLTPGQVAELVRIHDIALGD
jgi:hypothetical protein